MIELLSALFGPRTRLPRDHPTRVPRRVKKLAAAQAAAAQTALDELGALPGLADVAKTKQMPKGFYAILDRFYEAYDAYLEILDQELGTQEAPRPGTPEGCGACYAAPFPVHAVEALRIYRHVRPHRRFREMGEGMARLGETLFEDIQAEHGGKDPEKIRPGGKAAQKGRLRFAQRREPCPFLDTKKQRCQIWEQRPVSCRMHRHIGDPAAADPGHAEYRSTKAKNLRLPVKSQLDLGQLDRRMELQLSPFLYAAILQLGQVAEGEMLPEVGEPPQRMQQDGTMAPKANRNVRHAKKFKKGKGKGKGKGKKR